MGLITLTHTRYDSSAPGIGPSERPLPDNTRPTSTIQSGFECAIPGSERLNTYALHLSGSPLSYTFVYNDGPCGPKHADIENKTLFNNKLQFCVCVRVGVFVCVGVVRACVCVMGVCVSVCVCGVVCGGCGCVCGCVRGMCVGPCVCGCL